ncbi:MAG: glutamate-5-semialdehyde dehydrogenase, partial [Clostridia bacterium]|nr:glutamate-5-semialdehyde dehydrogenase [Clostridia bacterium]
MNTLIELGKRAKAASKQLTLCSTEQKNAALIAISDALKQNFEIIMKANSIDLENGKEVGLKPSMLDRLALDVNRITDMANGVKELVHLPDPTGLILEEKMRPNGIKITKISVPMGVIGIIYEARPNVTSDAAAICLKAGSAVILRGGKEAINSNVATVQIMRAALKSVGLPEDAIQLVTDTSRQSATDLMTLNSYLDLLIPRGGAGLIRAVVENSTVPVIETGTGNCHAFVDESADIETAANIVINGKVQRPSVCNALETLLVHEKIADKALPIICKKLADLNVEILGCEKTCKIIDFAKAASEEDFAR